MLWTATTALVLGVGQWDIHTAGLPASLLESMRLKLLIGSLAFGPLNGLAIAAVLIFLWRRFWTRIPFPSEPGHWLLVIVGTEQTIRLCYHVLYLLFIRGNESAIPAWASLFTRIAITLFVVLLSVLGASSQHRGRCWNACIAALALHAAITIIHSAVSNWIPAARPSLGGAGWSYASRCAYSLHIAWIIGSGCRFHRSTAQESARLLPLPLVWSRVGGAGADCGLGTELSAAVVGDPNTIIFHGCVRRYLNLNSPNSCTRSRMAGSTGRRSMLLAP